jgi:hypothetical protein
VLQRSYGLTFDGLPAVAELDPHVDPADPVVTVRVGPAEDEPVEELLGESGGIRRLADGRLLSLDRHRSTAAFYGPPLAPDLLAHPYLGAVATAFSRWQGREAFHAGAFVHGGRAWAVSGPRTAGKSTLLAALAARGTPVLSDDIVVTDGTVVFAGPRCLDLRDHPPFPGLDLEPARRGERLRLRLPAVPARVPLGGWLFLAWGPEPALERVPPGAALKTLLARRSAGQLSSDPQVLLALGTLPVWRLLRPRSFDAVGATLDLVDRTLQPVVAAGPSAPVHR